MATDQIVPPERAHGHGLPHSHGGAGHHLGHDHAHPHPHLHLTPAGQATAPAFAPGLSILRSSIAARLGLAILAALLIWTALHFAVQS